jgi:hypothetical protein
MKQYQALNAAGTRYLDGHRHIPAVPGNRHYDAMLAEVAAGSAEILPYAADMTAYRQSARAEVDRQAEAARRNWIASGAGQALVYLAQWGEAAAILADPDPQPAAYPLAAGRALRQGSTLGDVAAGWQATADAWLAAAAAIEAVRETAHDAIAAAGEPAAVDAVLAGLVWPVPA